MRAEVSGWLEKAEADYQNARILSRQRKVFLSDNICWSCQQSAEKYLKAYLISHQQPYPRSHDLVQLGNLCALLDPDFDLIAEAVAAIDQFGTDIRYPGVSASPENARQAFAALKRVRAFVLTLMGLK